MTKRIDKYIGKEKFEEAVKQNNYKDESYNEFVANLEEGLVEIEEYNEFDAYNSVEELLDYPIKYTNYFAEKRNEGFSKAWSRCYAEYKTIDDTKNLLMDCYMASAEKDKEQGHKDLMNYCKITNRSQFFIDYLLKRINDGDGYGEQSIEKTVEEFVEEYENQITKGKSELFAYQYADYFIDDYQPMFCEDFAFIYDESIKKGKSKSYAQNYAYKYASELIDLKARYEEVYEDALEFAKQKARAYINGWEYATENKLENKIEFIKCYEHAYLNTYYADNPNEWSSIEECENISIKKALEDYEKIIEIKSGGFKK